MSLSLGEFTVPLLKKVGPHIPVIEIPVSGYDVIKAIDACVQIISSEEDSLYWLE